MKHFGISAWSDYLRGVTEPSERRRMERHLESPCARCGARLAALRRVAADADLERRHRPPAWALRTVQALFSAQQPSSAGRFVRLPTRTVFDSAVASAGAGIRNGGSDTRQMVFYAQELAVSLQVSYQGPERTLQLDGELLHRQNGALERVPALLLRGNEVVGRAVSGELGEFQLSSEAGDRFRLWLVLDEQHLIELDIDPPPGDEVEPAN